MFTNMYMFDYEFGKKLIDSPFSGFFNVLGISEDRKYMYFKTQLNANQVDVVSGAVSRLQ